MECSLPHNCTSCITRLLIARRCAKTTPPFALPLQCYRLSDGLNGVSDAIQDSKDEEERYDLVGGVFEEIVENREDQEKEYRLWSLEEQHNGLEGSIEMDKEKVNADQGGVVSPVVDGHPLTNLDFMSGRVRVSIIV